MEEMISQIKNRIPQINSIMYVILITVISVLAFLFFGENGPVLQRDSSMFLGDNRMVEYTYPVYTFFVRFLRDTFGYDVSLHIIFIVQSVIACATSVYISYVLMREYDLDHSIGLIIYLCTLLPYTYSLPENMANHQIMTEALSIPLFNIYLLFLILSVTKSEGRRINIGYMFITMFLAFILKFVRSQMVILLIISLAIYCIVILWSYIRAYRKSIIYIIGLIVAAMIYIFIAFGGRFVGNILKSERCSSQFILAVCGRTMGLGTEEDAEEIDIRYKDAYSYTYSIIKEERLRVEDYSAGIGRMDDIIYKSNEITKHYNEWLREYYATFQEGETPDDVSTYSILSRISGDMIEMHWREYLYNTICMCVYGLVASIFIQPPVIREICYVIVLVLYLLFAFTIIKLIREDVDAHYYIPAIITVFVLFANVAAVNVVMYGIQRYVIYCMGMFYVSWIIMLVGFVRKKKGNAE